MGREINIDRIHDLEKQIEESAGDTIELKRARNSLLNISVIVPPEILGSVFRWNVTPDNGLPPLDGFRKGTYNFLLVCHHWFEVAFHTPELWSYWGNTLGKWLLRRNRSGTIPVDLVLKGYRMSGSETPFGGHLRDELRTRAAYDGIRSLHLRSEKKPLLTSIISTLIPDDEDVRYSSIESISLRCIDVSELFARCRFPKLWYLDLSNGVTISSWEDLGLHTTGLTTLSLSTKEPPTTPQLLSVLASNPRLQSLTLSLRTIPRDNIDESTAPVLLHHLKELSLSGIFHPAIQLLRRLDHPATMDKMTLFVSDCTAEDISGTLGPYVQDYVRRDGRFRDGLGVQLVSAADSVSLQVGTIGTKAGWVQQVEFARFTAILQDYLHPSVKNKLCVDFVACIPREHVVYLNANMKMDAVSRAVAAMPKLQEFHLANPVLGTGPFLQPGRDGSSPSEKILPSLRRLRLENFPSYDSDGWIELIFYLTCQTSGGQGISLTISDARRHICRGMLERMGSLVEELVLDLDLDDDWPCDYCQNSDSEGD